MLYSNGGPFDVSVRVDIYIYIYWTPCIYANTHWPTSLENEFQTTSYKERRIKMNGINRLIIVESVLGVSHRYHISQLNGQVSGTRLIFEMSGIITVRACKEPRLTTVQTTKCPGRQRHTTYDTNTLTKRALQSDAYTCKHIVFKFIHFMCDNSEVATRVT